MRHRRSRCNVIVSDLDLHEPCFTIGKIASLFARLPALLRLQPENHKTSHKRSNARLTISDAPRPVILQSLQQFLANHLACCDALSIEHISEFSRMDDFASFFVASCHGSGRQRHSLHDAWSVQTEGSLTWQACNCEPQPALAAQRLPAACT